MRQTRLGPVLGLLGVVGALLWGTAAVADASLDTLLTTRAAEQWQSGEKACLAALEGAKAAAHAELEGVAPTASGAEAEQQQQKVWAAHLPTAATTLAMHNGWWECARELVAVSMLHGVDVRGIVDSESRQISRQLNKMKSVLESSQPMQSISPAFQWAQSGKDVFVNAKFAHKLDAPATLGVEAENVTITERELHLVASKDRKRFHLMLHFFDEIDPEESTWTMGSVGRISFTLRKKNAPLAWPSLLHGKKRLQNQHTWWTKQEEFEDEIEELLELQDQVLADAAAKKNKKDKKKDEEKEALPEQPEEQQQADATNAAAEAGAEREEKNASWWNRVWGKDRQQEEGGEDGGTDNGVEQAAKPAEEL